MQMTMRPHSLFQKTIQPHTIVPPSYRSNMMASDTFTDIHTGFDDEFDYEPIDFRLSPVSSPTRSHSYIYEYISPHQSQHHHHHQHIMYNCVSDMQSQGYYPSPIVRRQDPNAELDNEASHCNSVGGNTSAQQSDEPMDCYSDYPLHDSSKSLPSPPRLLSQSRYGSAAPGPGNMDQRCHQGDQVVRFFPSYKPSPPDRWSDHPSPTFSQMVVGVSSSSRSPPSNSTTSSSQYSKSDMVQAKWNARPPAVQQSAPRHAFQESDIDWPRGQDVNLQRSLQSSCSEIEAGSSSSISPPSYQDYGGTTMRTYLSNMQSSNYCAVPQTTLIATYNDIDVLCGRGGATNSHTGNRKFRNIVALHRERYLRAKKRDKPAYAQHVLELVRNQSQSKPCRFLKKDLNSGMWYDIGDEKAREKVAQALREGAAQLRRDRKRTATDSGASRGNKKQKRKIVEIEVVKGATGKDECVRLGTRPEGNHIKKNPNEISSNQPTAVVNDRRDDSEGRLLSAPPLSCREGSEEISIPLGLTEEERSLYLTTFLPPRSQLHRGPRSGKQMIIRVR